MRLMRLSLSALLGEARRPTSNSAKHWPSPRRGSRRLASVYPPGRYLPPTLQAGEADALVPVLTNCLPPLPCTPGGRDGQLIPQDEVLFELWNPHTHTLRVIKRAAVTIELEITGLPTVTVANADGRRSISRRCSAPTTPPGPTDGHPIVADGSTDYAGRTLIHRVDADMNAADRPTAQPIPGTNAGKYAQ